MVVTKTEACCSRRWLANSKSCEPIDRGGRAHGTSSSAQPRQHTKTDSPRNEENRKAHNRPPQGDRGQHITGPHRRPNRYARHAGCGEVRKGPTSWSPATGWSRGPTWGCKSHGSTTKAHQLLTTNSICTGRNLRSYQSAVSTDTTTRKLGQGHA
jgi:hypothetical protein